MEKKNIIFLTCIVCIVSLGLGQCAYQYVIIHKRIMKTLRSLTSQEITSLKIYPGVVIPHGQAFEIAPPEPLIENFLLSLTDVHSFGSFANVDIAQSFFLEILGKQEVIQIVCHVSSKKDGRLFGGFVKRRGSSTWYYGGFRSEQLFHWHQKYRHRWEGTEKKDERMSIEN